MNELLEKRNNLLTEMEAIINAAKTEKRAFVDTELARYDEIKKELNAINKTIEADEESRSLEGGKKKVNDNKTEEEKEAEIRSLEETKFINDLRAGEVRELGVGESGKAVIPTHIAKRILEEVRQMSPILTLVTEYNVGGDLALPYSDKTTSSVKAAYVDDFEELLEGTGSLKVKKLENHIVGVLSKVSRSLVNRTDIDVLSFVVKEVATSLVEFLEFELVAGKTKMQGLVTSTNVIEAGASSVITAADIVDLELSIKTAYSRNGSFIMHTETFKSIAKLTLDTGELLLQKDFTQAIPHRLLGHPVHLTDSMPKIGADEEGVGNVVIAFGDYKGLHVKFAQKIELQLLREKYATQHALGVVGYVEVDSKIMEEDKIAVLKMKDA